MRTGYHGKAVKSMDDTDHRPSDYHHQSATDYSKGLRKQDADQNRKPCSWLFQGWRSKNPGTEEGPHDKNSKASYCAIERHPIHNGSSHQEDRTNNLAELDQSVPSGSHAKPGEVETKGSVEHVEEKNVDKDAEKFIDKMRRKMEMERLKSMKRYESMLRRGC